MNSLPLKPLKIVEKDVGQLVVVRYCLLVEFSKLFKNVSSNQIQETIENLNDSQIWNLLEAIGFTFRLTWTFFFLAREGYTWNKEIWPIESLVLTGMDFNTNKIIFSKKISGDAQKFKKYLANYHQQDNAKDPEGLHKFKPTNQKIKHAILLATEKSGKISILDGSHRLTEMLLTNKKEVTVYVGYPKNKNVEDNPKVRIGDSTIVFLTIPYRKGNPKERDAIKTLLRQLIRNSINGKDVVQKYWIDRAFSEDIKKAGVEVLNSVT